MENWKLLPLLLSSSSSSFFLFLSSSFFPPFLPPSFSRPNFENKSTTKKKQIQLGGDDTTNRERSAHSIVKFFVFLPMCSLLLPWQGSPTCSLGSEVANPVISTPHRLCSSEIPTHSVGWQFFSCVIFTFHDFGSFFLDFHLFFWKYMYCGVFPAFSCAQNSAKHYEHTLRGHCTPDRRVSNVWRSVNFSLMWQSANFLMNYCFLRLKGTGSSAIQRPVKEG